MPANANTTPYGFIKDNAVVRLAKQKLTKAFRSNILDRGTGIPADAFAHRMYPGTDTVQAQFADSSTCRLVNTVVAMSLLGIGRPGVDPQSFLFLHEVIQLYEQEGTTPCFRDARAGRLGGTQKPHPNFVQTAMISSPQMPESHRGDTPGMATFCPHGRLHFFFNHKNIGHSICGITFKALMSICRSLDDQLT